MKTYAKSRPSLSSILLALFVLILLVPVPVLSQILSAEQSPRVLVNLSPTVLEITVPDLRKSEVISIDVAGPDDAITHTESRESPVMLALDPKAPDGLYRYEVHVVVQPSGTTVDRVTGMFRVQYGQILVPVKGEGRHSEGFLPWFKELLGHFADAVLGFLISDAQAQDVTVSSGAPTIFFDDTDIVDTEWKAMASQVPYSVSCSASPANLAFMDLQGSTRYVVTLCSSIHNHRSLEVDILGDIHFAADGMFFDRSAKYLGINTTTPAYTVDAIGNEIRLRSSTAGDAKVIKLRVDGAATDLQSENADLYINYLSPYNTYLVGNLVGVGTTVPASKLHVVGSSPPQFIVENTTGNGRMDFRRSSGTGVSQVLFGTGPVAGGTMDWQMGQFLDYTFQIRAVNDSTKGIAINPATGYVGVGKTNPGYKLDVAGIVGGFAWQTTSDRRFKENIAPIAGALEKVMQLDGVSFNWKREDAKEMGLPEGTHFGVVAQQVEKVLPEIVMNGAGDHKTVSYTELVPVLIEAVKEQQGIISNLQRAIDERDARIEKLEKALEAVEQRIAIMETPVKTVALK